MTIALDQAKHLAEKSVDALAEANGDEYAVMHHATIEISEGWIFFYNSRGFIETGNFRSRLAGNGPIFVDRTGNLRHLPSAVPWQVAIKSI
jgi:hypothetical protein